MRALTAICAFATLAAAAPMEIETLHVKGLSRLSEPQVIEALGLKAGQKVEKSAFDAAQQRLIDRGVFASVGYSYEPGPKGRGYAVTYEVAEIEQVYGFRFEELPAPDAELIKVLQKDPLFDEKLPPTENVLNLYTQRLTEHLGGKVKVVARVLGDRPGEPYILFRPNTPRSAVAQVTFTGNKAVPVYELQNKMAAIAVGMPYVEENFREQLNSQVKPMYEVRGLVRASFPKITVERAEDVDGLAVTVEVNEGEPYKLEAVKIEGADEELLKAGQFKTGEIANFGLIFAGVEKMRQQMRGDGYMKVSTEVKRAINDQDKTVTAIIHVTPGPLYTMGQFAIKGLDIITEPYVQKLWGLEAGKPYRDGYPERVIQRIREEGVLEGLGEIRPVLKVDHDKHVVDVTLDFKPAPLPDPNRKKRRPEDPITDTGAPF